MREAKRIINFGELEGKHRSTGDSPKLIRKFQRDEHLEQRELNKKEKKRILITGGSGFIGTNAIEYFSTKGFNVLSVIFINFIFLFYSLYLYFFQRGRLRRLKKYPTRSVTVVKVVASIHVEVTVVTTKPSRRSVISFFRSIWYPNFSRSAKMVANLCKNCWIP